ncbi:hypothetical protein ES288_D05G440200v1 [Gossypium darwinii]|uniref:NB-ARC domain-containing protein n=1 Tax=Gossypium darwinii TaxID=34276 RepID=A0A5D2CQN8_GOSDA|nr:hypothetical protein ES288_D05G440200v1 [Gossypium darwinii]
MAEYVASTAVENVTNHAKECALPYLRYFFGYGEIVEDFTNQRKALKLRKQRVKTCVDEAKRKIEVIYEDVEDWLRSAEKELEETQNLEDEIDSIKCFKWCPKWGWRYCLSKKLAEKTPIISKLLEASNFPQVGYRGSLQGIEFITSTDFMDSESSKSALNQIMEAINAKGVKMIELHGMPGVGKTTLAQEVGKQAREQKLFDKVVMFTMSQNPNINKIQDKVADIFGLNFETKLKLERIGIPFGDEHKGCKILLTTRDQQVCTKMNYEAWVLFRGKAGLDDDSSTLNDVAKEVAAQCKGLPLAIVVVTKALKGESLNGWTTVNQRFKESRHLDNEKVLGDYEISLEILIMCGIGVGLNEIVMALKKLQKSGLILGTDDAERIRMHDVVRDFAHWLTSTGENRFMVKDELKEWPDMDGCYSAIALWNCSSNIKKLPDKVEFSKLKTLILEGDWDCDWNWDLRQKRKRKRGDLLVVSSIFFEEMKALQVLYLESLENFSSSLKNMRSLEILVLIGTKIDEISEELVKLSTLKYLRLSGVGVEEEMNIPPNLVSRLTSLQELHVISKSNISLLELNSLSRLTALSVILSTNQISQEYFVFPKLQRYAIAQTLKTVTIANFSSSLTAFNNLFCNVKKLKLRNVSGQKNIVPSVGKTGVNELTSLKLASCKDMEFLIDITSDQGPTVVFSNLVKLNIHNMVSLKGLCYGLSRSHRAIASLTRLRVVTIGSCHQLKTIFSPCLAQSMLCIEKLFIFQCDGVEQVIGFAQEDEIPENDCGLCYWPKLRILHIQSCKSLKYVCASTSTPGLQSLEFLHISHCPQFMQIFNMEQNENGQDIMLPGFRSQNYYWPKLKTLRIMDCPIFSCFIVQARLLEIHVVMKLEKCIFSPTTAHNLSHLVNLFVEGCEEIERLILAKDQVSSSSSSNASFLLDTFLFFQNECLKLKMNSKLEEVFELEDEVEETAEKEMNFDKLEWLSLEELLGLIHFCPKGYHFVLSALRVLTERDCPKLTTDFFIDSQEFQDAIRNPIFSKNINWNWRWVGSQLPQVT